MSESNLHRIPGKPARAVGIADNARRRKAGLVAAAGLVIVGVMVVAAGFVSFSKSEPAVETPLKTASGMIEVAPPPAGLTAEQALALAEERLKDGGRSGVSLAEARRLAMWAVTLGAPAGESEELRARIDTLLDERWRRGRFAYLHARKLRRAVAADAALRALRETFPAEHPRSREIDRLERRP